jgi:AraC-like DNA-binding protein
VSSDAQKDAFDIYRDSFVDMCDVRDVADNGRSGFRSRTRAHLFGPAILARARSSGQTLAREAEHLRAGLDHINLIVNLTDTVGDCDGRTVRSPAGSVMFRDLRRPSVARTENIDLLTVMVPRAAVPSWLLSQDLHGLVLPGTSAGGKLVVSHLMTLSSVAGELTEMQGLASIEAAFSIAQRFMGDTRPIAPRHLDAIHRGIRERTMALLDAQPIEVRWSADTVARAVGVSRTSLYRAFEQTGGVRAYVVNRRLSRAYSALRGRKGLHPSIEEIGQRNGFPDKRSFVMAFRARFGVGPQDIAPSDFRLHAANDGAEPAAADRALHDVIGDWMRVGEAV